jgi:hypothetical protein
LAIDSIEHMFEYKSMALASATPLLEEEDAFVERAAVERAAVERAAVEPVAVEPARKPTVQELQDRIRSMQATKLDEKLIPTHPALAGLLPGGGLKQGAVYSLETSATLLMALLAAPSQTGSWCGIVGMPEFGVEAAASFGIDLERLVLVPDPGNQWLAVTAAMADVMTVVVTKPPVSSQAGPRASEGNLARLAARLRQRGSTLIVTGNAARNAWSQSEALLSLSQSEWSGIGEGNGHLSARQVTVTVSAKVGRPKSARLWLPDPELKFVAVSRVAVPETAPERAVPDRYLRAV